MSEEHFNVIVVGAGLAGLAAAYTLAKAGKEVLVIERGTVAGSKNVSGGRLYSYALEMIEPGLTTQARLERAVTHEQLMLLEDNRSVTLEYTDPSFNGEIPQSYTVLRAVFDEWFAEQVETQGVFIAAGVHVDDLIEEEGKIVGVIAGEDEMRAEVVIAADGVNSLIAQKAGLRPDITYHEIGIGVKEVIELPASVIEDRFHLCPQEGAARMILGGSNGVNGGGFLYTNRDSISLGCVFLPQVVAEKKISIHEIFQNLKMHPAIFELIEGGRTIEYSAHLVPEAGWKHVPAKLHRPGFLMVGDAAGFVINQGYTIRGMDLALLSGLAAAKAIIQETDISAVGPAYIQQLDQIGLTAAMKQFADFPSIMDNPRLFSTYPAMANDVFKQLYAIDEVAPESLRTGLMNTVRNHTSLWSLVKDGWNIVKSMK